jgi:dynein heavy chain
MKDFSMMSWSRLDAAQIMASAVTFSTTVKRLASKKLPGAEQMHPYIKLSTTIQGFIESLPLIESLKSPAIHERHWKRIMEETGQEIVEINLKVMTLNRVFELELQNHEDKVMEIIVEAREEAKNEENLQKIEHAWRTTLFEIDIYYKGSEMKGYKMKSPDEVTLLLEENILILQSLNSSKYVRSIKSRVQEWERNLNIISDVKDNWLLVQRKWIYLESIFASDDIKM